MTAGLAEDQYPGTKLKFPCYGFMNIVQMNQQKMLSKHTPFKVTEISPIHIGFISYLSLPINENVTWVFQFGFQNEKVSVSGIVKERQVLENGYAYIAEWLDEEIDAGVKVQQAISSREGRFNFAFEKAIRGYANYVMNSAEKIRFDVSC